MYQIFLMLFEIMNKTFNINSTHILFKEYLNLKNDVISSFNYSRLNRTKV